MHVERDTVPSESILQRNLLKSVLVGGDVVALVVGSLAALWIGGYLRAASFVEIAVVTSCFVLGGVWSIRSQGLLLARTSAVRVVELTKLFRACILLGIVLLLADRVLKLNLRIEQNALACIVVLGLLVVWRSAYRAWIAHARANGRHVRPTVVIASDVEAFRLVSLVSTHRDLGIELLGLVGSRENAEQTGLTAMWLGDIDDAERLVDRSGASGVLVSPNGIEPARFNSLIRNLQRQGQHIFLTTGLAGIESRRLRSMSLAHEPMLYVEAPKFNKAQSALKRGFDLVVASMLLVIGSPIMLAIALVVKLGDRGPVFFRQQRVGRNGVPFDVVKFRTMAVDAERHLPALAGTNERSGPLFKMTADPRVTRAGRWLRESSLDELPQLFNVLRGQMSLVGPRPALPAEVERFSPELRMREMVLPGITGLWQVEARDNPSFEAYRRLDLFYVENWSIALDLLVVLATIEHMAVRFLMLLFRRESRVVADGSLAIAGTTDG
jgi:exopolysaccharide biosynthesis polyprenyl glycosylphosphotransferase